MQNKMIVAGALIVVLAACAPIDDAPSEIPPREALVCPPAGYLNCMPIVPAQRRAFCAADARIWIVNNCPDVEIVY